MKHSFFSGMICLGTAALTLCAILLGVSFFREQDEAVFKDVTVELGTQTLGIADFLTDPSKKDGAVFVSDVRALDLGSTGTTPVTLRRGSKTQTVQLTVQDTTAPAVEFLEQFTAPLGYTPVPEDFISAVSDSSSTTAAFVTAPAQSDTYSDQVVELTVTDQYGNTTTGKSTLRFDWIHTEVVVELGTPISKADILLNPEKDDALITQEAIDEINLAGAGKYMLTVQSGDSIKSCNITIQDTQPPALVLQQVSIYPDRTCKLEDFIVSAEDASGDVTLELLTELPFGTEGDHTVQIKATDKNGLSITGETQLRIHRDITPPTIYGMFDVNLTANQETPDYMKNVYAVDTSDGHTEVTYDASDVDLTRAGIYYVVYTSADTTGNIATRQRKVTVKPDYADTAKLIEDIASTLEKTDPESLRDYVRNNISYSSFWGG